VILLDLQMPELGGLEILRELRADEVFDRICVIILTASKDDKLRARAIALGATDVIHKSLGRRALLSRLRSALLAQERQDQQRLV
jgi:CheY-like chemotaxis protein